MKAKGILILIMAVGLFSLCIRINAQVRTSAVVFEYEHTDIIYNVYTKIGFATAIELSEGQSIKHFVIGDPKWWKAESEGRFSFVRPLETGIQTSLAIITMDGKILVLNLIEISELKKQGNGVELIAKAKLKFIDDKFFRERPENHAPSKDEQIIKFQAEHQKKDKLDHQKQERTIKAKLAEERFRVISNLKQNYKIKDKHFSIESVSDDGIFTYINVESSTIRPAVFMNRDGDNLEPVKYIDRNGIYVVHAVLKRYEQFVLKVGKKVSTVKRVKG